MITSFGLFIYNGQENNIKEISKKQFDEIGFFDAQIILSYNGKLYKLINDQEIEIIMKYNDILNFDICNEYIWMHNRNKALIYSLINGSRLEYDNDDGILGNYINDLGCNDNWVWFCTDNGISFYNWRNFHNEK